MAAKLKSINLVPIDKFSKTIVGRVINWLLSTFRVIVIMVEFVVMGAFLSRFWLDAKNSDVTDELRDRQFVVEASKDLEDEMNLFSAKVYRLKTLSQVNTPVVNFIVTLPTLTPPEITLINFEVYAKSASISGQAVNENFVNQFLTNLKSYSSVQSANTTVMTTNNDTGFLNFQIETMLK